MKYYILRTFFICLFLVSSISASTSFDLNNAANNFRQNEWNEFVSLYEKGTENTGNNRIRRNIFLQAIRKLKLYTKKYAKDHKSLEYLKLQFRLANTYEWAMESEKALKIYVECQRHPLYRSSEAKVVIVDSEKSISDLVIERINTIQANLSIYSNRSLRSENDVEDSKGSKRSRVRIIEGSSKGNDLPPHISNTIL